MLGLDFRFNPATGEPATKWTELLLRFFDFENKSLFHKQFVRSRRGERITYSLYLAN